MKTMFSRSLDEARSDAQSRVFVFNVLEKLRESRERAVQDVQVASAKNDDLDKTVASALADVLRDDATSRYPELQSAELDDPQRYIVAFVL